MKVKDLYGDTLKAEKGYSADYKDVVVISGLNENWWFKPKQAKKLIEKINKVIAEIQEPVPTSEPKRIEDKVSDTASRVHVNEVDISIVNTELNELKQSVKALTTAINDRITVESETNKSLTSLEEKIKRLDAYANTHDREIKTFSDTLEIIKKRQESIGEYVAKQEIQEAKWQETTDRLGKLYDEYFRVGQEEKTNETIDPNKQYAFSIGGNHLKVSGKRIPQLLDHLADFLKRDASLFDKIIQERTKGLAWPYRLIVYTNGESIIVYTDCPLYKNTLNSDEEYIYYEKVKQNES